MRIVRDRTTWMLYGQLAIWAYFIYSFAPVVPLLRTEQHTSRMVASLHSTAFAVGAVIAGTLLPSLVRRYDRGTRIRIGLLGVGLGVIGLLLAEPFPLTVTAVAVSAAFGTILANSIMAELSEHHGPAGPAAISEGNALAAGIGLVAPLLIGLAVSLGFGWRPGMAVLVLGVVAVVSSGSRSPDDAPEYRADPVAARTGRLPRRYWLVFIALLGTASVEVGMNQWVADVLLERTGMSQGAATACVSAIIAGMFVGRLVASQVALRVPSAGVMLGGLVLSAAGFAVFWLAGVAWVAIVGLGLCGLGNAVHFPFGIALAIEHSNGQPDLATAKTSYAFGAAFGLAPFALGSVADLVGPHTAFLLVPLFLAVSAAAVVPLARGRRAVQPAGTLCPGCPEIGELDTV